MRSLGKLLNAGLAAAAASATVQMSPGTAPPRRLFKPGDPPPRRLSTERHSPAYDEAALRRVLVKFDGVYRNNDCHAYDADEGWIDVRPRNGKGKFLRNTRGEFVTERKFGKVEPEWKALQRPVARPSAPVAPPLDQSVAAAEKRARKAAKRLKNAT